MKTLLASLLLMTCLGSASAFASDCSKANGNKETRAQEEINAKYLALLDQKEAAKIKPRSAKDGEATR